MPMKTDGQARKKRSLDRHTYKGMRVISTHGMRHF
jgi:hypothetical protein